MIKSVEMKLYMDKTDNKYMIDVICGKKRLMRIRNDDNLDIKDFVKRSVMGYMEWNPDIETIWFTVENLSANELGVGDVVELSGIAEYVLKNYNPKERKWSQE